MPGVKVRGAVSALPFTSSVGWGGINVEGFMPQPGQELQVDQRAASPTTSGRWSIPLRERALLHGLRHRPNAQPVVIVDEKFARASGRGENPIGKHLWNDPKRQMTIVGVVGTVKQYGLDIDGRIVVYRPTAGCCRTWWRGPRQSRRRVAAAIVREIHAVDPTIPVYDVRTMQDRMRIRWRGSVSRRSCSAPLPSSR